MKPPAAPLPPAARPALPTPPPASAAGTRERLERKLDSYRPASPVPPEPLADEDVTGVIELAVGRVAVAGALTRDAIAAAAERIEYERERVRQLSRELSTPPPLPKPQKTTPR